MAFRSKTPERAFDEIDYLARRHKTRRVGFVDNILDMKYVTTLFPKLAAADFKLDIFYEVKANLRYDQLKQMRAGGLTQIQPGIESFSDSVLKLMEKGCTGLQNIQLLRWSKELGIEVAWNILGGFPGEDPGRLCRDGAADAEARPSRSAMLMRHGAARPLQPVPFARRCIRLQAHAPGARLFLRFPVRAARAQPSRLFLRFRLRRRPHAAGLSRSRFRIRRGIGAASRYGPPETHPRLDARYDGRALEISDSRACATAPEHVFKGLAAELYARCDQVAKVGTLALAFGRPTEEIEAVLDDFERRNLLARSGDNVLSLAVFRARPAARQEEHAAILEAADA